MPQIHLRRRRPWSLLVLTGALVVGLGAALLAEPIAEAGAPAKEAALVELGRRLFFDPIVSRTGSVSCASCHDPEHGFSDPAVFSADDVGRTFRHSQPIIDSAFQKNAHWDGEFRTIEALVTARIGLPQSSRGSGYGGAPAPLAGHSGVAFALRDEIPTPDDHADDEEIGEVVRITDRDLTLRLAQLPRAQDVLETHARYGEAFDAAFGDASVSRSRIARAIGAYCRSVTHELSAYDRHAKGDRGALSESAKRGLALFKGRAGCAQCHTLAAYEPRRSPHAAAKRAAFTDRKFHNTGIAWLEAQAGQSALRDVDADAARVFKQSLAVRSERGFAFDDPGIARLTGAGPDRSAFKTPTLRDATRRGPYMHNGMFASLADVVRYYARGGSADKRQDPRVRPFKADDRDVHDLVAFLESLTSGERPGLAKAAWRQRAKETRLRLVDDLGWPLAGWTLTLTPAGDRLPAETGRWQNERLELTTDAKGYVRYAPPAFTHVRLSLPHHLQARGGPLIPDSTQSVDVHVPIEGRADLVLVAASDRRLPATLLGEHLGTLRFDGHAAPRTCFERTHVIEGATFQTARYRGWLRTDVPAEVQLQLPTRADQDPSAFRVTLDRKGPAYLDLRSARAEDAPVPRPTPRPTSRRQR